MASSSTWAAPHAEPRPAAPTWLVVAVAAILAATFGLDLALPQGYAAWVPYIGAVLLGLSAPGSRLAVGTAIASTVLVVAGAVPAHPAVAQVAFNRAAALSCIWAAAVLVSRTGRMTLAERSATRELHDVTAAVDQSAIVAMTDQRGIITFVNDRFCEISKYPREALIGRDHRILNSGHHPKEYIRDLWRTIAQGRTWRGELRNKASDGSFYWVDTTIVPFLDERGKPVRYVAIRYDITERKRAQQQLLERASLTRLGQMAAVIAHEVRNPLAGVGGALQVLQGRFAPDAPERPVIAEMLARLGALEAMLDDLLVFARPRPPRKDPFDLRDACEAAIGFLGEHAACRDARLRLDCPEGVTLRGDARQLQDVITNLVLNAVQAAGAGAEVEIRGSIDGAQARIDVVDHGPGIPPERREEVFEPFVTTKHRGTGLGLAIARRVVEMHGGSLQAGETPGGGATMTVTLPATDEPVAAS